MAGVGRALDAIEDFRFDAAALTALEGIVDPDMLEWLGSYRFSGDVWGYAEGEAYFPYSPLLVVEGTFAEAVLLETVLLSVYNHDSAIASAASRMTLAAGDRPERVHLLLDRAVVGPHQQVLADPAHPGLGVLQAEDQ